MQELLAKLLEDPESSGAIIETIFAGYKPLAYKFLSELFNVYKDWVNNDEYFKVNAEYYWKRFKALTICGFSQDQAMALILNEDSQWRNTLAKNSQSIAKSTERISKSK